MKKKSLLVLGLFMSLTLVVPTSAANVNSNSVLESNTASSRAEQLQWCYRYYKGKLQKRCWSITYGYWKTDWMNV